MNDIKPMDFSTWVYESNIEEKYRNFHERHYQEYLEEFMRQLSLARSKSADHCGQGIDMIENP